MDARALVAVVIRLAEQIKRQRRPERRRASAPLRKSCCERKALPPSPPARKGLAILGEAICDAFRRVTERKIQGAARPEPMDPRFTIAWAPASVLVFADAKVSGEAPLSVIRMTVQVKGPPYAKRIFGPKSQNPS